MSAPLYNAIQPQPRRHPLAPAPSHYAVNHAPPHAVRKNPGSPPPKQQEQPKKPASPPLPRQSAKVPPPSPPKIIIDRSRALEFTRVGMLGEGGFARVYEVQDVRGHRSACKVITKRSLKDKKTKTKLYAEIKIHKSLEHPSIVRFQDCFEDEENVYMMLELCHNGSLMDMLRRRRRFTEPEARFYMVQLIGACNYMHTHQVIHRDLKLGNIFLDRHMNVKVGDFGLAALIEKPGERKKTICGTPNYIAPEVLFDKHNGHSFEVDTWSIGVILYTLIIGRPPFQTKDVREIYKRIEANDYGFPEDRPISAPAQELVTQILIRDPSQRPTLHEIVDHTWFTTGTVPGTIPVSAHDTIPDFRHLSREMSRVNLARLRRATLLDEDQMTGIAVPSAQHSGAAAPAAASARQRGVTPSLAQQEKEFQKAIQPGSPISALLSSARQPLIIAPQVANGGGVAAGSAGGRHTEQPLLRKLQAAKEATANAGAGGKKAVPGRGLQGIAEVREPEEEEEDEEEDVYGAQAEAIRKKELERQKVRIVAQMVPAAGGSVPGSVRDEDEEELENLPPRTRTRDATNLLKEKERERTKEKEKQGGRAREQEFYREREREREVENVDAREDMPPPAGLPSRASGFDLAAQTLQQAFEAKAMGRLFRDPAEDANLPDPRVFIVSWVDYCNKYGMGYALTDGSVGVHFNDTTTIVLSPDKCHFDFISGRRDGSAYVRKNYTVGDYPTALKSKVYLLKHFEKYIMDKLYGDYEYTYDDVDRTKGMDFMQRYLRMKHVIVFKMSNDVLQFNFYDHTKLILSSNGRVVTHIDKQYNLTRHTLAEVMANALRPPVEDREQAKFNQRLVDKLKYCKEVLVSIKNVSESPVVDPKEDQRDHLAGTSEQARPDSRLSKASLR